MSKTNSTLPVLYSFRRCPYAMRARLALFFAKQTVEHREVILRDIPKQMTEISPKATVPVMQLQDGRVIDESLDIVLWALEQNDPQSLMQDTSQLGDMLALIDENDHDFKGKLDRYKYFDRFPAHSQTEYREQGEVFLQKLEQRLSVAPNLFGDEIRVADIAIMPFVRQFAHVDKPWFDTSDYPNLRRWLGAWLISEPFTEIMVKYPQWQAD